MKFPGRAGLRLAVTVCLFLFAACLVIDRAATLASAADPLDWPMWRGPEQNGISRETGIVGKWTLDGENVLWQSKELGTRSTPIVMNGKLYTLARSEPNTPKEGEQVICADAATGKVLWRNQFNVYLSDVPAERVAWSCVVGDPATGRVYAYGVCGYLVCIDGETGKTLWNRSLVEEFGTLSTYGGRTNVPVIFEDLVIINAVTINWGEFAKPQHRFMAFDKNTGECVWFNGTRPLPDDTTYSTPVLCTLGGRAAMVFGSGDGAIWAFQPRTGVPLWQYKLSIRGLNVTPTVDGDKVYMAQSEENFDNNAMMGVLAAINGAAASDGSDITKKGAIWHRDEIMVGKSSMLLVDGRIYGVDDSGSLFVFDAATGQPIGRKVKLGGTIMRSSLLYADGKIYACSTSVWHVLEPTKEGVKVTHRLRLPTDTEAHGSPIVSHGRLYLPTTEVMYCLGTKDAKPAATPRPELPKEAPLGNNKTPTHVQVVPAESYIKPGETVQFKVRVFNDHGQLIGESPAKFTLDGGGQISADGKFTADAAVKHSAVIVTAKVGELAGTARVRVMPPLPWKFDFSDGQIPITWLGTRVRHIVRDVEGNKMLVKVTTVPKGTRSQGIIGPPTMHDFTIQADVRGSVVDGKLPDIGLVGQRYTLDLMGENQKLQIRSWTSQLNRFSRDVALKWEPDTWYTLKFRVETAGPSKAVLKGKLWKRGEAEPEAWTIEATDEAGNVVGAPGLWGNASNAEFFLDNLTITPN